MADQKIVPCIWFIEKAEEAVKLYTSLIPNSKMGKILRYGTDAAKASGQKEGDVLTISFTLGGMEYLALNGGPADFLGTGAGRISLIVNCEDQAEIDKLWDTLKEGGMESQCGWLTDKYGITWQIVPKNLDEMLAKSPKAWQAMLEMKKIEIKPIEEAV